MFPNLLNRTVTVFRRTSSGVNTFGEQINVWNKISSEKVAIEQYSTTHYFGEEGHTELAFGKKTIFALPDANIERGDRLYLHPSHVPGTIVIQWQSSSSSSSSEEFSSWTSSSNSSSSRSSSSSSESSESSSSDSSVSSHSSSSVSSSSTLETESSSHSSSSESSSTKAEDTSSSLNSSGSSMSSYSSSSSSSESSSLFSSGSDYTDGNWFNVIDVDDATGRYHHLEITVEYIENFNPRNA